MILFHSDSRVVKSSSVLVMWFMRYMPQIYVSKKLKPSLSKSSSSGSKRSGVKRIAKLSMQSARLLSESVSLARVWRQPVFFMVVSSQDAFPHASS